jgi:cell division GTPase FtsZ
MDELTAALNAPHVHVVGIGGGGCRLLREYCLRSLESGNKGFYLAVDTDLRALKECAEGLSEHVQTLCVGEKYFRGFSSGGDAERVRQVADENDLYFQNLFENRRLVVVLTALGGGVGNGFLAKVAAAARRGGALVWVVTTLPFEFEGHGCSREALRCVRNVQTVADGVVTLPNDLLFQVLPPEATVPEAFVQSAEWVRTLLDYALTPASSHDNDSFMRLLSTRPEFLFFAWGVGKDTFAEAIDDLFRSPFWKTLESPADIQHLSISTFSNEDVSLVDLRDLNDHLGERFKNVGANGTTTRHGSPRADGRPSIFILAAGNRHNFDVYRYGHDTKDQNKHSSRAPNDQFLLQFGEISDNDDYLDIPTYLRKGLRINL